MMMMMMNIYHHVFNIFIYFFLKKFGHLKLQWSHLLNMEIRANKTGDRNSLIRNYAKHYPSNAQLLSQEITYLIKWLPLLLAVANKIHFLFEFLFDSVDISAKFRMIKRTGAAGDDATDITLSKVGWIFLIEAGFLHCRNEIVNELNGFQWKVLSSIPDLFVHYDY